MTRAPHRLRQRPWPGGGWCPALTAFALLALLAGCGMETPPQELPAPTLFTVGTPAAETLPAHGSFFGRFVATSATHTIALSALTSDHGWSLFADPSYTAGALIYRCDAHADASDESCQPPPLLMGRTYYLRIDEQGGVAGSFTLTIG